MDRERKLLYVVAVLAPIMEIMTLVAWQQMSRELPLAVAAERESAACQAQLLRAWAECPLKRERRARKAFGTSLGNG
jgi:hypothetical protein